VNLVVGGLYQPQPEDVDPFAFGGPAGR
jgi:hypothetical protein